jgi:hypothetical protein
MKYFKVKIGYGADDYISITTPQNLEKALYLFASKEDGFLDGKPVRGVDIITITEDWNKALGVADSYKLNGEDQMLLSSRGIKKQYAGIIEKYSMRVEYLLKNGKKNLIGQKVDIPELDAPKAKEISEKSKKLSEGMKMPE